MRRTLGADGRAVSSGGACDRRVPWGDGAKPGCAWTPRRAGRSGRGCRRGRPTSPPLVLRPGHLRSALHVGARDCVVTLPLAWDVGTMRRRARERSPESRRYVLDASARDVSCELTSPSFHRGAGWMSCELWPRHRMNCSAYSGLAAVDAGAWWRVSHSSVRSSVRPSASGAGSSDLAIARSSSDSAWTWVSSSDESRRSCVVTILRNALSAARRPAVVSLT